MELIAAYFVSMLVSFLLAAVFYYSARAIFWFSVAYCRCGESCRRDREESGRVQEEARERYRNRTTPNRDYQSRGFYHHDRQGNIYTISDDTLSGNNNRYADFFYLEPNSEEAARIRAQLEKDEKDLPSYEDVMGMNNLNAPTAGVAVAATGSSSGSSGSTPSPAIPALASPIGSATPGAGPPLGPPLVGSLAGSIRDPVPPYSEIDPIAVVVLPPTRSAGTATTPPTNMATSTTAMAASRGGGNITIDMDGDAAAAAAAVAATPSTSRAAAAAALVTTIPIVSTIESSSTV